MLYVLVCSLAMFACTSDDAFKLMRNTGIQRERERETESSGEYVLHY